MFISEPTSEKIYDRFPVLRPFRHRDFSVYYVGQAISMVGTWMANIAMSWLIYRLTNSAILLGLVGFLTHIPQLILGPFAGTIADRYDRLKVIKLAQFVMMFQAVVMAFLSIANIVQVWHLLLLSFLLGIALAFDMPARQAFVVKLVGLQDLPNAIGLNASLFNGARMVGPAIAGLVVAKYGEGICFTINAISFLAVIAGLYLIRLEPWVADPNKESVGKNMKEGLVAAFRNPPTRKTLSLIAITSLVGMPFLMMLPPYVKTQLSGGAILYGWIMASSGAGAMIAALTLVQRVRLQGLPRRIAIANCFFGLTMLVFAFVKSAPLAMFVVFWVSFASMVQLASSNVLVQMVVEEKFRGRVMGIYGMMFLGMLPLGALWSGFSVDHLGAQTTFAIMAALLILSGIVFYAKRPVITEPISLGTQHTFSHRPSA